MFWSDFFEWWGGGEGAGGSQVQIWIRDQQLKRRKLVFYVFVYTVWLKRKTPQNIVIGGASGALPPVIGWTIATNSLTFEPITLFLIIFYWTPSHFWALSLYKAKDYEKAKIPMLPNTNGVEETKKKIFIYSLFMLPVIILPYYIGFSGKLFLVTSLILTVSVSSFF